MWLSELCTIFHSLKITLYICSAEDPLPHPGYDEHHLQPPAPEPGPRPQPALDTPRQSDTRPETARSPKRSPEAAQRSPKRSPVKQDDIRPRPVSRHEPRSAKQAKASSRSPNRQGW